MDLNSLGQRLIDASEDFYCLSLVGCCLYFVSIRSMMTSAYFIMLESH